jgi:hypothetical protein
MTTATASPPPPAPSTDGPRRFTIDDDALSEYLNRARARHDHRWDDLPVDDTEELEICADFDPRHLPIESIWDLPPIISEAQENGAITGPPGVTVQMIMDAGAAVSSYDACYGWQLAAEGIPFALTVDGYNLRTAGAGGCGTEAAAGLAAEAVQRANSLLDDYEAAAGRAFTPRDDLRQAAERQGRVLEMLDAVLGAREDLAGGALLEVVGVVSGWHRRVLDAAVAGGDQPAILLITASDQILDALTALHPGAAEKTSR